VRRRKTCIVCASSELIATPVEVAPFLAERVWGGAEVPACRFQSCRRCGISFYDVGFDPEEMQRLYSGYRGERYTSMRNRHEPGYADLNAAIGGVQEIQARRRNLDRILAEKDGSRRIRRLLDYGGDTGQFIPDRYGDSEKYVYEISGVPPAAGVTSVGDPSQCAPYDFVMCCHLLEHVSDPLALAKTIAGLVSSGGIAYFEVPWDPFVFNMRLKRIVPRIFQPPLLHEHVNFFTAAAATTLIERVGLEMLDVRVRKLDFGWMKMRVLSVLAEKPERPGARPRIDPRPLVTDGVLWVWSRTGKALQAVAHVVTR
jgi:hypothetical protein